MALALLNGYRMKNENFINRWFAFGLLSALAVTSIASVPTKSIVNPEAISEIKVSREGEMSQEPAIQRLTQVRPRYVEKVKVTRSSAKKAQPKKVKKLK